MKLITFEQMQAARDNHLNLEMVYALQRALAFYSLGPRDIEGLRRMVFNNWLHDHINRDFQPMRLLTQ